MRFVPLISQRKSNESLIVNLGIERVPMRNRTKLKKKLNSEMMEFRNNTINTKLIYIDSEIIVSHNRELKTREDAVSKISISSLDILNLNLKSNVL